MEEVDTVFPGKLTLRKRYFFVIGKYVEDVKQGQKSVPHLVKLMMRLTDPVKEELRKKTMKMTQLRPRMTTIRVCTFEMS